MYLSQGSSEKVVGEFDSCENVWPVLADIADEGSDDAAAADDEDDMASFGTGLDADDPDDGA